MPPLPNVPKVLKVELLGTYQATSWAIIFHEKYTGSAAAQADMDAMATNLGDVWANNLQSALSTEWTMTQCKLTDLDSNTGLTSENAVNISGTDTDTPIPAQCAVVASWKIARRYRGGKPRSYVNGLTIDGLANQKSLSSGGVALFQGKFQTILTALNSGLTHGALTAAQMVNVSYYSGFTVVQPPGKRAKNVPTLRPGGPVVDNINSVAVHPRLGTQRRRLGKETT